MAASKTAVKNAARAEIVRKFMEFLAEEGEDVMLVNSNTIAFPTVIDGEDEWFKVAISIPSGSRDGEPYDGYGEAESYKMKEKERAAKAQAAAEAKAKKIARDKTKREKAKEIAAQGKAQ